MSLELVNTLATFGTFELTAERDNPETRSAERFVLHDLSEKLKDPTLRYQLANPGAMTAETQSSLSDMRRVGNFFENMGALVKNGLAGKGLVLDIFAYQILNSWEQLTPVLAIIRQSRQNNAKIGSPRTVMATIPRACGASI